MTASPRRAPTPAQQYVPFLRLEDYSAGGMIPDGDYLLVDFSVMMFTPTKKDGTVVGPARLSVRVTFDPPTGATTQEERREQNYSLGTKAHLSFQPDPETGKRLVPVEGAPAGNFFKGSNFELLLESIYNSDFPPGIATDDLRVLEGMVVHIKNVPEPESRKELRAQNTGEVAAAPSEPRKIPIVTEIISAPWMQQGAARERQVTTPASVSRMPASVVAPPAVPAPRAPLPLKPNGPPALPLAAPQLAQPVPIVGQVDNETAVAEAILSVIGESPNKLSLQTACFRKLTNNQNRQEIMTTYFSDDNMLSPLLNQMGYQLSAGKILPL